MLKYTTFYYALFLINEKILKKSCNLGGFNRQISCNYECGGTKRFDEGALSRQEQFPQQSLECACVQRVKNESEQLPQFKSKSFAAKNGRTKTEIVFRDSTGDRCV